MKFFLIVTFLSSSAWAIDSNKCSGLLNKGLYKKYKFAGMGEANMKAVTGETKNSNIASASSKISTENTTVISDPKYYSNVSTSQTQSTSSFGECSAFALQERRDLRDQYVAQNLDQIKKDVAMGDGGHLEVLSWFSLCEDSALREFNEALQNNLAKLVSLEASAFSKNLDQVIRADAGLAKKCYVLDQVAKN